MAAPVSARAAAGALRRRMPTESSPISYTQEGRVAVSVARRGVGSTSADSPTSWPLPMRMSWRVPPPERTVTESSPSVTRSRLVAGSPSRKTTSPAA